MPKIKTNRGAAKRIRVTKSGKIKFQRAGRRHLLSSKNAKRKRRMCAPAYVGPAQERAVLQLLPYAF